MWITNSLEVALRLCLIFMVHQIKCDDLPVVEMGSEDFMGNESKSGFTAAFGDINSDKQTDVFVISESGKEVLIFLGSQVSPALNLEQRVKLDDVATSVVSADFNGDDISDFLVTYRKEENSYSFSIYWGKEHGRIEPSENYRSTEIFHDEPLLLDANADMIADLFVVYKNQTRGFLVGQESREKWDFAAINFKTKESMQLYDAFYPHSHAFIDLTGEGSADIFITTKDDDGKLVLEIWQGSPFGLVLAENIRTSESEFFKNPEISISPTAFIDFNSDGNQDILVSTCVKDWNTCKDGNILLYSNDQWHTVFKTGEDWNFPDLKGEPIHRTLHIGDFNLDSYPDVLLILQNKEGVLKTVILYNKPCSSDSCAPIGRQLNFTFEFPNSDNSILAAFYDFDMDGTQDVIISTKTGEKYEMKAYKNMIADDVTFLRAQVLSGRTETAVYGVNVPGPYVRYKTTNTVGDPQYGSLGQLSQSAHLSLQLPYVIFGLGRAANFVDRLTVSVPVPLIAEYSKSNVSKSDQTIPKADSKLLNETFPPLNRTWPMLIPNSQMYVIPYPQINPTSWKNKLLVTPGRNVVTTGIVLLSSMGVLSIATLILHLMERKKDKQEKIQEAYRFHFDAM